MSKFRILPLCLVTLFLCTNSFLDKNDGGPSFESPLLVKKDQRTSIVATEFGEISAIQIGDGYHIQFITLEPNALLLPLLLHSDMVFFVHTGSGTLNWVDEEKERTLQLRRGDVFRLRSGTVFYVLSNLESGQMPEKLSVYAIFDVGKCLHDPCLGAYSNIRDLLLGFNEKTIRSAFAVPEELMGKLRDATKPPLITNALPRNRTQGLDEETWTLRLAKLFVRVDDVTDHLEMKRVVNSKNKKKSTAYNVFEADPDFENVNGQSIVVDEKDTDALKGSSVGVYMVNLTKGSIMGPHWNPNACEISIVLRGEGMIRVVNHSSSQYKSKSESERFMVEEGDVFVVPQFHPMAQMSFVNSSFMFMGFSTSAKTNHPQFLVGQSSVLKVIDRKVLAASFNMRNETIQRLLGAQKEGVILECVSCAEVELSRLTREIDERKRREEEETERRKKEEEEARKKEEERKEEEEAAKRQEEERRRREEEAERRRKEEEEARKREEERKKEEEAATRREEERRRREEEETERKRKEAEEARKREEERKKEEEAAKRREEERRRREEEETERKRKEEEEARKREEQRKTEEAAAKRREEERRRREKEEEEARKREEAREREEERKRREKEEEEARKREEAREREEEKAKRQEEERKIREKEEEEARKREEEREREEDEAKRQEEERTRREKEKEATRKREEEREKEEEMAKRREEVRQRKEREEAETKRREEQERKRREEEAVRREREEERQREEEAAKREEEERRRREEEQERRPPPQTQRPIDH